MLKQPRTTRPVSLRAPCSAPGTAMSEMVLALPIILLILSLLYFFGRGMVRVQHTQVADRFDVWREGAAVVYSEPGTAGYPVINRPPHSNNDVGNSMLNDTFFAGNASSIRVEAGNALASDASEALVARAAAFSANTGAIADQIFSDLPDGRTLRVWVSHVNTVRAWEMLEGDITHAHTRSLYDWRYVNGWHERLFRWDNLAALSANTMFPLGPNHLVLGRRVGDMTNTVTTVIGEVVIPHPDGYVVWSRASPSSSPLRSISAAMYEEMDDGLGSLEERGNGLAGAIRDTYLAEPGYIGPVVSPP